MSPLSLVFGVLLIAQVYGQCTKCGYCQFANGPEKCGYERTIHNYNTKWGTHEVKDGSLRVYVQKPVVTSKMEERGRTEYHLTPMLRMPYQDKIVRTTYTFQVPITTKWGQKNEPGCIAQWQEMGNSWTPAFMLMARSYDWLDFAVFRAPGRGDTWERTLAKGILGKKNTIEILSLFTTGSHGFHKIKLNGVMLPEYKGKTLPTGAYDLHFKVGAYSMGNQIQFGETWIFSTDIKLTDRFAATSEETENVSDGQTSAPQGLSSPQIIGIVVGVVALVIAAAIVAVYVFVTRRNAAPEYSKF